MTGFDPTELARLAAAATPGEVTVLSGWLFPYAIRVGLGAMRIEDAEFIAYCGTHRDAIVAAVSRAHEAQSVIEQLRELCDAAEAEEMDGGDLWMELDTILRGVTPLSPTTQGDQT